MKKTSKAHAKRRPFPYAHVVRLWDKGRTIAEIARRSAAWTRICIAGTGIPRATS
jgi:hypothetical protein